MTGIPAAPRGAVTVGVSFSVQDGDIVLSAAGAEGKPLRIERVEPNK